MADWTEDEKREFEQYRKRGQEDAEHEAARIHVGDRVDTPDGPGYAIEEEMGGFLIKLEADLPPKLSGTIVNPRSREGAFYVPKNLLRRLE
jgi:hypothetical protein